MKVMAIRTEAVPGLKPSTRLYIQEALSSSDIGVKSARKDFLEKAVPDITKVKFFLCLARPNTLPKYHIVIVK